MDHVSVIERLSEQSPHLLVQAAGRQQEAPSLSVIGMYPSWYIVKLGQLQPRNLQTVIVLTF